MAKPSLALLDALRRTVTALEETTRYQWGHMGSCNCGFLAQSVTKLSRQEIHRRAMMNVGDWTEQLNDYCPTSGIPMAEVISQLIDVGFDTSDLQSLERLSDPEILGKSTEQRSLCFNVKADVITYLKAWVDLIESQLIANITLPELDRLAEIKTGIPA